MMIAEVEAEQAAALDAEEGRAARLICLRGIGLASASVLADEVFFRDATSVTAVKSLAISVSSRAHGPAVECSAIRGLPNPATPAPYEPRSNSAGCDCGISRAAS
jgi:hypothetical protein